MPDEKDETMKRLIYLPTLYSNDAQAVWSRVHTRWLPMTDIAMPHMECWYVDVDKYVKIASAPFDKKWPRPLTKELARAEVGLLQCAYDELLRENDNSLWLSTTSDLAIYPG